MRSDTANLGQQSKETSIAAPIIWYVWISAIFLMGGGSRPDIISLALLRPLAFIVIGYCLIQLTRRQLTSIRYPVAGLLVLTAIMLIQLVPLPPALWQSLPGNDVTAQLLQLSQIDIGWRPITRSPSATLNSLLSLSVPFSALLLFAVQRAQVRNKMLLFIIAIGIASCLLALLQILTPQSSTLYTYRISNFGEPVGLFANKNHQAVFLNVVILFLIKYFLEILQHKKVDGTRALLVIASALLVAACILFGGSRMGFGLLLLNTLLFILGYFAYHKKSEKRKRGKNAGLSGTSKAFMIITSVLVFVMITVVLFLPDQLPLALDRFLRQDLSADLRFSLLPVLLDMSWFFQPWGAGFGSFENVYEAHEPLELLKPSYLNEAHNDWLQIIIEGGVFAVISILLGFMLFVRRLLTVVRENSGPTDLAIIGALAIVMFGFASVFDYPLRTPSLMTLFILLSAIFFSRPRSIKE